MDDGLFSGVELSTDERAGYRLHTIEVFNWGTFDKNVWSLEPRGETSLLTGDIGSGKSTLVDALTTLLLPAHKVAYNKAAGADARERSLRSYVEGHYRSERVEASGRSRAIGLREGGRTYSVILGVFVNEGFDETVTLAQVFQQRDRSTPDRFFVTASKRLSISSDFTDFGSDMNDLRRRLRSSGATISTVFPEYGRALRKLLGIRSEQALELFHQTVSMKSVSNLNEFVRSHMLEPADSADRVRAIIGHFEDLSKAHDAVTRAREQLEALTPLVETCGRYDRAIAERDGLDRQRAAVRLYVAELRIRLSTGEIDEFVSRRAELDAERAGSQQAATRLAAEHDALIEQRAQAGGNRIGELERLARDAREQADERRRRRTLFDAAAADAQLPAVTDRAGFLDLTGTLADRREVVSAELNGTNDRLAGLFGTLKELANKRAATAAEIASLTNRTNNLPQSHVAMRDELCAALRVRPEDLPFAGELLDVTEEQAQWRGAAERVLRGFALSLLVRQEHYEAVAGWVNSRRLTHQGRGIKLVYERVTDRQVRLQRPTGNGLLLSDCLDVKVGPFERYLRHELGRRADYRCVETMAQFRDEKRAVTPEGQVRSGERHEKDDRTRVDDPRTWVLGWANERKIAALQAEEAELTEQLTAAEAQRDEVERLRREVQTRQDALGRLRDYTSWSDIDHAEATERAEAADAERARLTTESNRLAEIADALERNAAELEDLTATIDRLTGEIARLADRIDSAERQRDADSALVNAQDPPVLEAARAVYAALTDRLGRKAPTRSADCAGAAESLTDELDKRLRAVGLQINGFTTSIQQYMDGFLRSWPELRSDMDAHPDARHDFLAYHQQVAGDDLPRHEAEFKRLLNTETIRELAQFNNWLRRQADEIDTRIGRINEALGAIPYNPGRYIRLEKERTDNQDVATFRADLRTATDDALATDDDHYSEQRFLDVKRIIERFRGREGYADTDRNWTRRVTDVRNWFVFSASERDLETDDEWEHYSDSDGKSGGQKEKLAYTILAASLAYQFGLEWGATRSKDFRFAVIDEAFGRGSDMSTRYALDLFAKLGLQLLIVTPLQKVHIIEPYVRTIGFVDNPNGTYSRLRTMTIEEYREQRNRPDR